MGTAFLLCPKSGIHQKYKEAVLAAESEETALTRAFSGKPACSIRNRFLTEMEGMEVSSTLCRTLTRRISRRPAREDRIEFMSLWAGQASRFGRAVPAAKLVESVAQEATSKLEAFDSRWL